jgi:hypothetical protein
MYKHLSSATFCSKEWGLDWEMIWGILSTWDW